MPHLNRLTAGPKMPVNMAIDYRLPHQLAGFELKPGQDTSLVRHSNKCVQILPFPNAMFTAKTVQVLGISFQLLDYEKILKLFADWIPAKTAHQVCLANVHTLVTSLKDKQLRAINDQALTAMDGTPLVWYANLIHNAGIAGRLSGPDLMLECLDKGRSRAWKHYFLGAKPQVLSQLTLAMRQQFPGVEIVGEYAPPFRELSAAEDQQLVADINAAQPDFLWVALGAPKQEKWIAEHLSRIQAPIQIGVGAAFDFLSGHKPRAPLALQKFGLEWLYRLLHDRRLLKRYVQTNPVFIWLFVKHWLARKVFDRFTSQVGQRKP
ncbi:WecB/TagA/CpsF family glycosyltransferase [Methylomonas paludis]|uniref:WecB/TagA/CpsF family glycosyltransferase n=1 Tax=Methylomonas paludis TaxID=1173101 RepID=A0A975R8S3_9GAMM|nr:WecB/TagA/CpsF family glycosyltransferase [Methylomonas paludis]QWF69484.1 WecB/TagA/CpsF family glycosyltransferase [Methylomonas paludis]